MQLLQITAAATYPYNTRLAGALCFKNFIKRNWADEDGNYKLQPDEVLTIKRELISLMIVSPQGIQSQLGEAVSVIADSDFWERWDTLVDVCALLTPQSSAVDLRQSLGSHLKTFSQTSRCQYRRSPSGPLHL